jgi:hypothetical protein
MTSADLRKLLRLRYPPPEWAYFDECRAGTGAFNDRTADGIAMGLYPSRGMPVIGFEIKVSRHDWIRELKAPDKAEAIAQYCNQWYIVAADAEIVRIEELPPTWGLLVPIKSGKSLRAQKEAPRMKPIPLDRRFIGSLVRKLGNLVPAEEVETRVEARLAATIDSRRSNAEIQLKDLQERHETLRAKLGVFLLASGLDDIVWNGEKIGAAVRRVMAGDTVSARVDERVDTLRNMAAMVLREIDQAREKLPKTPPTSPPADGSWVEADIETM